MGERKGAGCWVYRRRFWSLGRLLWTVGSEVNEKNVFESGV